MAIGDQFSILWVSIGTVVFVMIAAEIGFQAGSWLQRQDPESGKAVLTEPVVGKIWYGKVMAALFSSCARLI